MPARRRPWPTGCGSLPGGGAPGTGRIDDIVCFVPGEDAGHRGEDTGAAAEPVTMMDYHGLDHLPQPGSRRQPTGPPRRPREHRLLGLRCPACERIYAGGRGYCPVDAIELGPECEVDLPQKGTITNYTIVTPVQYPGQTETEPFARAFVLLDGTDVILPSTSRWWSSRPTEVHVGQRVDAVWASPAEETDDGGGMGGNSGSLLGWIPNGEPDVDDPDLVNRIF